MPIEKPTRDEIEAAVAPSPFEEYLMDGLDLPIDRRLVLAEISEDVLDRLAARAMDEGREITVEELTAANDGVPIQSPPPDVQT